MKHAVFLFYVFMFGCATTANKPEFPLGAPDSFYRKSGIVETYYEIVTMENKDDLSVYLGGDDLSDWREREGWYGSEITSTDELWFFNTDPDSWKNLAGSLGFCILREREVVSEYLVMGN